MRFVQTFWTAGRNPLEHGFGWLRPEFNLMSWALSCLSLREHYDEVALYTDEQGKHVLIDLLHLPYTEVNVVYDEKLCLPQHWAYAKIKTYSLQTKPFLHVDGDVFLPKPISEDVINATLMAQNKETGTEYYRRMMDGILQEATLELPDYIGEALREAYIASYNMGVFGGNDLAFIHAYCEEAQNLYESNKAFCSDGNFNLLFEQILFACKVKREHQSVCTIFPMLFNDNGYTVADFCQLCDYEHKGYFHILGGHKRNQVITESLAEALIIHYPDYYRMITTLYSGQYTRGVIGGAICVPLMTTDIPISSYIDFLNEAEEDWCSISWEELYEIELRCIEGRAMSRYEEKLGSAPAVCLNPCLKCFDVPTTWGAESLQRMRERFLCKPDAPIERIAVIPTLSPKTRREYVLYGVEHQVLELLKKHPMQISELVGTLTSKSEEMRTLWHTEIRILLNEGLLIPFFIN